MGLYPALVVLGIYDRCTPKLASDASRAVAMLSSLAEAQAQLRSDGIALDIKTLRSTAYRYAARARAAQQSAACGLLDRVTGKRVVVSLDGGRVRVRRKKRGPKTKKGRNRFHTDWKEPKLLILYVVGDDGRPSQTWAPIIDGTLRGPEAVFALLLSYARQIGLNAADKVLFIADGAPWIWRRLQRLIAALGLSPTQVLGLIDFYHAAKQLSDAVKLRRWSATQRTRWLNRTRGLLKRARVDEVITALRELCRGRTAGKIRTHLNYFLKNRHRFAYTTMVGLGLPRGSGAVESAIRRVINLRIKGASIYWLPESVDAILLLRSFYKSGQMELFAADGHDAGGCERVTGKSGMRPWTTLVIASFGVVVANRTLAVAFLLAEFSLPATIAAAFDAKDFDVVGQPVDQGHCARSVGKGSPGRSSATSWPSAAASGPSPARRSPGGPSATPSAASSPSTRCCRQRRPSSNRASPSTRCCWAEAARSGRRRSPAASPAAPRPLHRAIRAREERYSPDAGPPAAAGWSAATGRSAAAESSGAMPIRANP